MKNPLLAFVFILSFCLSACSDNDGESAQSGKINIRLRNASDFDYTDALVKAGEEISYGTVKSGQDTDYREFNKAYRYAYVELRISGQLYKMQPVDFVGAKELEAGNYTYEIYAKSDGGEYDKLILNFVKD